ncbi:MAG: hypothetical protein JNM11_10350 [Chitinimonas sp.]|nr:hypothetical protein [Chitinimonas sp.]
MTQFDEYAGMQVSGIEPQYVEYCAVSKFFTFSQPCFETGLSESVLLGPDNWAS